MNSEIWISNFEFSNHTSTFLMLVLKIRQLKSEIVYLEPKIWNVDSDIWIPTSEISTPESWIPNLVSNPEILNPRFNMRDLTFAIWGLILKPEIWHPRSKFKFWNLQCRVRNQESKIYTNPQPEKQKLKVKSEVRNATSETENLKYPDWH